jgi:hypothetical protein
MKKKLLFGIVAGAILILGATVQAQEISPGEFRERMIAWATASEQTFKTGEHLADKIAALTDEQIEIWISTIEDPNALLKSLERAVGQLKGQKMETLRTPPVELESATTLTTPFPPDYPPGSGPYKTTIIDAIAAFGIGGASSTDRCSNTDWGDFVGVWWPLNKAIDTLDGACVVAGCEPTGVLCLVACGILETAKIALKIAAVPLEACDVHQGAIDGAEIEATYENTLGLVGDVSHVHDDLTVHETNLATHDTDIKALLATIQAIVEANGAKLDTLLARQLETIRLLHTPQGQRNSAVPACDGGPCEWPKK